MEGMAAVSGIITAVLVLIGIVAAILGIFVPFFILRIRNEIISANQKLSTLIDVMHKSNKNNPSQ